MRSCTWEGKGREERKRHDLVEEKELSFGQTSDPCEERDGNSVKSKASRTITRPGD